MTDRVADVTREVLVRHLEAWAPAALHRGRRAVYLHGWADAGSGAAAQAALRVFVEQSDLVRGRELTMVAIAVEVSRLGLPEVPAEAAGLTVHTLPGETDERVGLTLKAIGGARVPLLGFLDSTGASGAPSLTTVAALAVGKPAEALLVLAPGALAAGGDRVFGDGRWRGLAGTQLVAAYRSALSQAGFPLVAAVELVAGQGQGEGDLLVYATTSGKSLESFKDLLWAVDEYAGVRYRDPGDPERHLIDISLNPHPGPLRREILRHLAEVKQATVTELRTFALTDTVYRAADASRVLHTLIEAGAVRREPEHGRLGGDVVITPVPSRPQQL
ncbi:MAG: hypothetical protein QOE51_2768 [Actinoplanes sp.]|jgi:hypothetical protein|nr:hypothetical protein [Actinoplanes sp.]